MHVEKNGRKTILVINNTTEIRRYDGRWSQVNTWTSYCTSDQYFGKNLKEVVEKVVRDTFFAYNHDPENLDVETEEQVAKIVTRIMAGEEYLPGIENEHEGEYWQFKEKNKA